MGAAANTMKALAERRGSAGEYGAHTRIGRRASPPALGKFASTAHVDSIQRRKSGRGYGVTSTPFQNAT
jgi:hypothetical protein